MTLVFMFPGQSSRYPGMLPEVAALHPRARAVLDQASAVLDRDLVRHYRADHAEAYSRNRDVQIGVFVASQMFLEILDASGLQAVGSLGLSLGEWNHMVHIGALPFAEALRAVAERGAAYDAGPRGAMASVFPISAEELTDVAQRASAAGAGLVEVVNFNSPRQQVLSGEAAAVDEALRLLERDFYVEAQIIERQVPMHSSLFAPVGQRFGDYLATRVTFGTPSLPYLPNRLAQLIEAPEPAQLVELLSTHVHMPVLWQRSVDLALSRWPGATLVEVGPKSVLYNLLDRKWHREVRKFHTDSAGNKAEHLQGVIAALQAEPG